MMLDATGEERAAYDQIVASVIAACDLERPELAASIAARMALAALAKRREVFGRRGEE
jgi:hypothetical protein